MTQTLRHQGVGGGILSLTYAHTHSHSLTHSHTQTHTRTHTHTQGESYLEHLHEADALFRHLANSDTFTATFTANPLSEIGHG